MQSGHTFTSQVTGSAESPAEILLVTRNLPPLVGGMETLVYRAALILGEHYRLTVIGPKGCRAHLPQHIRCREVPSSLPGFLLLAPLVCLAVSRRQRFNLVIGGSGLAAVCLWLLSRVRNIPTACFVHGLDIVVENTVYQRIFLAALRRVDALIANSHNTRRLCIERGINGERVSVLHPGCDLAARDRTQARRLLLERCSVQADLIVLSAGRIVPRKGLLGFVENGFADLLKRRPGTILVVVGDSPQESLAHRNAELPELAALVKERGWEDRVHFLGKVDQDTLAECYAGADALVFPLLPVPGDVEGFGMVAIEAAAQGTPTFAFAEGGVVDAVVDGVSGRLLPGGDYRALVIALAESHMSDSVRDACRQHAKKFGWDVYAAGLLDRVSTQIEGK